MVVVGSAGQNDPASQGERLGTDWAASQSANAAKNYSAILRHTARGTARGLVGGNGTGGGGGGGRDGGGGGGLA